MLILNAIIAIEQKLSHNCHFAVLMSIHCFSTHNFVAIAMSCIPLKIIAIYATCILVSLKMLSRQGTMETQFDVQGKKQGKAIKIEEARQGV